MSMTFPAGPKRDEFLVVQDSQSGRTILVFDVTEDGVRLEYEQADLPAIAKAVAEFKGLVA